MGTPIAWQYSHIKIGGDVDPLDLLVPPTMCYPSADRAKRRAVMEEHDIVMFSLDLEELDDPVATWEALPGGDYEWYTDSGRIYRVFALFMEPESQVLLLP